MRGWDQKSRLPPREDCLTSFFLIEERSLTEDKDGEEATERADVASPSASSPASDVTGSEISLVAASVRPLERGGRRSR